MTATRFYFRLAATVNGVLVERECTDPEMRIWRERRDGGPWTTTISVAEAAQPPKLPQLPKPRSKR